MLSKARHVLGKNGSKPVLGRFPFSRSGRPKRTGSGELSGKVQGARFENSCVPFNSFNPVSPGLFQSSWAWGEDGGESFKSSPL